MVQLPMKKAVHKGQCTCRPEVSSETNPLARTKVRLLVGEK